MSATIRPYKIIIFSAVRPAARSSKDGPPRQRRRPLTSSAAVTIEEGGVSAIECWRAWELIKLTLPVMFGYLPIGMAFGFLMVHNGGAWWMAPFASVVLYAGAAQFASIALLAAGQSPIAVMLAITLINLRHVFYGFSVIDRMPTALAAKLYLIFSLTDETYSLITSIDKDTAQRDGWRLALLNQLYWIFGSFVGAMLGVGITFEAKGLEFTLTAMFCVLALSQYRAIGSVIPAVIGFLSLMLALVFVPNGALFTAIGMSAACLVSYCFYRLKSSPASARTLNPAGKDQS